jgi:putative ABC transport system substrate-binding protein
MKKISVSVLLFIMIMSVLIVHPVTAEDDIIEIGVLQLVEHASLDAAYQGFVDALKEAGYEDGVNIKIDYQNAQGDQANLMTISERFVKNQVDLILAIATPRRAVCRFRDYGHSDSVHRCHGSGCGSVSRKQ